MVLPVPGLSVLPPTWPVFIRFYLSHGPTFPTLSVLTSTCPTSFLVLPVLPTSTCPAFLRSYLPRCPTSLSSRSYLSSHLPSPTTSLHLSSVLNFLTVLLLLCSTTFLSYFPPGSTCPAFLSVLPPTYPTFVRVLPSSCSFFSILHFPFRPSSALSFTQLFVAFAFVDLLFLEHFLHPSLAKLQLILQITAST